MNAKFFVLLACAFLEASATPLVSTVPAALNNAGATVSETVVTPFHRTDAISTPCGHSVVRTTANLPVVSYGLTRGAGFLGTGAGLYPGVVGGYLAGGVGAFPGVVAGNLGGIGGGFYSGLAGGLTGYNAVGGAAGAGIVSGGLGVYPAGNLVV